MCVALFLTSPNGTQKQPDKTCLSFILRRDAPPRGTCLLFVKVRRNYYERRAAPLARN